MCAIRAVWSSLAVSPRPIRTCWSLLPVAARTEIASNRLLADLAEKPAIHRDNLIVFA